MRGFKHNANCHLERPHYAKGLCESCYNKPYGKAWCLANSERAKNNSKQWRIANPNYDRIQKKALRDKYRNACCILLGDRCANPNCRYLNVDGTLGCRDRRLFHLDHIEGGGRKERKKLHNNDRTLCRKILKTEGKGYRILCASCNWLHLRHEVI